MGVREGQHKFVKLKSIAWLVCCRCGLVALRNAATKAAIRAKCKWFEDDYK